MRRRGETFGGVCNEAVLSGWGINVIFVGKMLLPMVLTARMGYNEKKIAMEEREWAYPRISSPRHWG